MKILIVDDDDFFLNATVKVLQDAGHSVVFGRDGREAIQKAFDENPDLVILDVILPGLLGNEVCDVLRRNSCTSNIPILLVSSGVAEVERSGWEPDEFLADDFLKKPFSEEDLLECVDRLHLLKKHRREGSREDGDDGG